MARESVTETTTSVAANKSDAETAANAVNVSTNSDNGMTNNNAYLPVTHVIWDLDGLLMDTENCYMTVTNEIVSRFGKTYDWSVREKLVGIPLKDSTAKLIDILNLPLTLDELVGEIEGRFSHAVHALGLMPGCRELVEHLHSHGIPMAIGTGSNAREFAEKTGHLGDFFKLGNNFSHVVTSDDPEVKQGKPAPDTFLVCAQRFETHAKVANPAAMANVLVFEDSPAGVIAAKAAGMQVVMVPDPQISQENRSQATLVLDSMRDFQPNLFGLPAFANL